MSEEVNPTRSGLTVFAPGAWAGNEGKVVPIIDRDNFPQPRQLGIATVLAENQDGSIGLSVQLFSATHTLEPRGDLSLNEGDMHCRVCSACSCHTPNRLLSGCSR